MVFARQVLAGRVTITRKMPAKAYPGHIPICGFPVSGVPPQAEHLKPTLQIPVISND
jgi:hypothetical protein